MTRQDLHRLVDALPDDRIAALGQQLAEDFGALVEQALGRPGEPRPGEGDLDEELEQDPKMGEQFRRAIERLKRGELGVPQAEVERRFRG